MPDRLAEAETIGEYHTRTEWQRNRYRELLREARAHLGALDGFAALAAAGLIAAIDRELED